jgi:hypothetical protein
MPKGQHRGPGIYARSKIPFEPLTDVVETEGAIADSWAFSIQKFLKRSYNALFRPEPG